VKDAGKLFFMTIQGCLVVENNFPASFKGVLPRKIIFQGFSKVFNPGKLFSGIFQL